MGGAHDTTVTTQPGRKVGGVGPCKVARTNEEGPSCSMSEWQL